MTERIKTHTAEQDEALFDLDMTLHEIDLPKVAITVDLPSEFQALLIGICSDGGRDSKGNITKLWKIQGIQSIDFTQLEPGKTMVFNVKPDYDRADIYSQLNDWLINLRLSRQRTEKSIASWAIKRP